MDFPGIWLTKWSCSVAKRPHDGQHRLQPGTNCSDASRVESGDGNQITIQVENTVTPGGKDGLQRRQMVAFKSSQQRLPYGTQQSWRHGQRILMQKQSEFKKRNNELKNATTSFSARGGSLVQAAWFD